MKPLPVSLSPSAKNLAPRSGGRGSSALRHGSVKQIGQGRQRAVALNPTAGGSGKFGLSEDDLDEIEQNSRESTSKPAEAEPRVGQGASPSATTPAAAPKTSSFTIRKDPPQSPDKPIAPATPNKGAQRGLLGVAPHAPRASSPLAQQPPVTASPDSSVGASSPIISSSVTQPPPFSFARPATTSAPAEKEPAPKNPFAGFGQAVPSSTPNPFGSPKPSEGARKTTNGSSSGNLFGSAAQAPAQTVSASGSSSFQFGSKPAAETQPAPAAFSKPSTPAFSFGADPAAGPTPAAPQTTASPFSFGQPSTNAAPHTTSNPFGSAVNGSSLTPSSSAPAGVSLPVIGRLRRLVDSPRLHRPSGPRRLPSRSRPPSQTFSNRPLLILS